MGDAVSIFFMGIVLIVIAVIISGRRSPNSPINHDTTNSSNFTYFGSDDTNHSHHHGFADHGTSSDFFSGDSGSCNSGDCGGGCDGGGGGGG